MSRHFSGFASLTAVEKLIALAGGRDKRKVLKLSSVCCHEAIQTPEVGLVRELSKYVSGYSSRGLGLDSHTHVVAHTGL